MLPKDSRKPLQCLGLKEPKRKWHYPEPVATVTTEAAALFFPPPNLLPEPPIGRNQQEAVGKGVWEM